MKKAIMLLLAALCTAATTLAYDFKSGDLYYNITSGNTAKLPIKIFMVQTTTQDYLPPSSHLLLPTTAPPTP